MLFTQRLLRGRVPVLVSACAALGLVLAVALSNMSVEAQRLSAAPDAYPALLIMNDTVIKDSSRINDPCEAPTALKPWGFTTLMKDIMGAKEENAVAHIQDWLQKFRTSQTINGETVAARDIEEVWETWKNTGWNPSLAPFQLMAIVNRIDLLRSPLLAGENAGELRFVFRAISRKSGTCQPVNFTVILEYGVRRSSCKELGDYASEWLKIGNTTAGSPDYNNMLWPLTDAITQADPKRPKPNGSAIDHLRTNENVAGKYWELREFRLDKAGALIQDTVTLTPKDSRDPKESLNKSDDLKAFLGSIDREIKAQDYWVPPRFPQSPQKQLLGGMAIGDSPWDTGVHPPSFISNTCSGCHGVITGSVVHIDPDLKNEAISAFLKSELDSRKIGLGNMAAGCSADSSANKRMVH